MPADDRYTQSPDDILDYPINWQYWLAEVGDTIDDSVWELETGLVKVDESFDDNTTTVWVSGGSDGADYELVNRITTAAGRVRQKTITVVFQQR